MSFLIGMRGLPSVYDQRFAKYRFWALAIPFGPFWPQVVDLTLFKHFWALTVIWQVWNIWNINRNMIFLIKMRGLPSLYDQRFTRYRLWALLIPFGPFWPYLGIFEHFRLSDRYATYETLTETWSFWLKWGVYQVSTTNGSRDIDSWLFWPLLVPSDPIRGFLSTSGYLTGMKHMKH